MMGIEMQTKWAVVGQNGSKKTGFWGPKKRPRGPPGRGVLRFSRQAYRRPVHFLPKNAVFSKNRAI